MLHNLIDLAAALVQTNVCCHGIWISALSCDGCQIVTLDPQSVETLFTRRIASSVLFIISKVSVWYYFWCITVCFEDCECRKWLELVETSFGSTKICKLSLFQMLGARKLWSEVGKVVKHMFEDFSLKEMCHTSSSNPGTCQSPLIHNSYWYIIAL